MLIINKNKQRIDYLIITKGLKKVHFFKLLTKAGIALLPLDFYLLLC